MNIKWTTMRSIVGACLLLPIATHAAQFSIVVIPDTQMYVEQHPEVFEAQVDWIVANQVAENIVYVAHLGDLKDDLSCDTKTVNVGTGAGRSEWQIVDQTLADLDVANIPYGVVPGNHDFDQVSGSCPNFTTQRPLGTFNSLVGPGRFAGDAHYGDPGVPTSGNRVVNSNEDNFTLFDSNGVKFIAINLAYRQGANAVNNDPEVVWADALLKAYPDRLGIITSHYFMDANPGNNLGPYGQEIYDGLSNNPNMFMMLSAHEFGEAWLVETTGRGGMEDVQILLSDYQRDVFPAVDGDINTPPNDPNPAGIDFTDIDQTSFGDSGFMRIMRFDTVTGMVNIETFIPPVIPIKNRPGTLVSTYFPADGNGMGESTASNLSFSYLGYVPMSGPVELVSCGTADNGGDLISRGFYHPSYPGTTIDTVELRISSRAAGSFRMRLDARLGAYNGALIASDTATQSLSGINGDAETYLFDMGGAAISTGSIVTFALAQETGPDTQVFYEVDSTVHVFGGPGSNCDIIETEGTAPPLDTMRRDGVYIRINGSP